jgi:phage tail sheath protein FI
MAVRPGVRINQRTTPPTRTIPTDSSVWLVAGLTDAGPVTPLLIRSMADYERYYGLRTSYSVLYDALELYFREGGSKAYVSRVVGPAAVVASKNLLDAGAGISLVVKGLGPGAFYNTVKVGVRAGGAGGTFIVFVQDLNNVEVETSPDLASQQAAILWSAGSAFIRITLGATALAPAVVAAAVLAGGTDDRTNIVDANWQTALDALGPDLGVGQISAPGRTTDTGHLQVLAHASAKYRTAVLDAPDTPTVGTLQASTAAKRAGNQRFGGMFWPWVIIPGVLAGTTRSVPPSALIAGMLSRNDARGMGVNKAAAGDDGVSNFVTDLSQPAVADSVRQTLNDSSVNVIRRLFNTVRNYGWRSLVDPVVDPDWRDFGNSRLYMAIAGDGMAIAEGFVFDKIDGQGKTIAAFAGALTGMLQNYWNNQDLYGASAAEAFYVDVGGTVNTPTTIAAGELHAVLNVKMSPSAEYVEISIYKKPISEGVTT